MVLLDLKRFGTLEEGIFWERLNRFTARGEVEGRERTFHIADTGRLEEILTPGRRVLLLKNRPDLKTDYTLIAAHMEEGWVLINSRLHTPIAQRALEAGILGFRPREIRKEVTFGNSRLDFFADGKFIEVKGCSLVIGGRCLFPNAPTERGTRHLLELMEARRKGFGAVLLTIASRRCHCFSPHFERDPKFGRVFGEALADGVQFKGFFIKIGENCEILYDGALKLCYNNATVRGVAQPG
ncbi:MAG: DNA/RNA nuclease SfsA [Epsilonproteobacteria bacterium]|nr:DNA/RNA nuclease SfsA [Campylobacterota bacterium]NPA57180.1 DNA/RNA nuclease SfsA [Campylobacterota bacterium]